MEALQDWTSPRFEEELRRLGRGGMTFEFLRRNKRYRDDYKQIFEGPASGSAEQDEAEKRLSQRWGVTFPG
ncbi:transcriptional regulator domain-containing protein [Brucella pseudintermedia]|uniref:transcriptional regulator domain-containing protein n=1 Tax=Brucella pseudintermedia TaxID=370111 RepID=UPI00124E7714|nr:DUF6499 domain-containing protein [Brucella pseudintermedia]KAB2678498.1 hypothetical protein F9K78_20515 [Brucella pseudintermedia]